MEIVFNIKRLKSWLLKEGIKKTKETIKFISHAKMGDISWYCRMTVSWLCSEAKRTVMHNPTIDKATKVFLTKLWTISNLREKLPYKYKLVLQKRTRLR